MEDAWKRLSSIEPDLADDLVGRVERGAALLDSLEPGWHLRIDGDRLAMETCDRCILGQLHGEYAVGYRNLMAASPDRGRFSATDHGLALSDEEQDMSEAEAEQLFDVFPDRIVARFSAMAQLWRWQVGRRRALEIPT